MTSTRTALPAAPHIHDLLRDRWSPRVFDESHELTDEQLAQLLEAARWTPSAGNGQPWAFVVLRRGEPEHERFLETLMPGNATWVPRASAVVVALRPVLEGRRSHFAAYDLGQAAAHLTVQAQALGLHVHQFAGFDHERAAELLEVPEGWEVLTGIAVGVRPAPEVLEAADPELRSREDQPRERKPLAEIGFAGRFGRPIWG